MAFYDLWIGNDPTASYCLLTFYFQIKNLAVQQMMYFFQAPICAYFPFTLWFQLEDTIPLINTLLLFDPVIFQKYAV